MNCPTSAFQKNGGGQYGQPGELTVGGVIDMKCEFAGKLIAPLQEVDRYCTRAEAWKRQRSWKESEQIPTHIDHRRRRNGIIVPAIIAILNRLPVIHNKRIRSVRFINVECQYKQHG